MAKARKRGDLQWQVQIRRKGFKQVTITRETKAEAEAEAKVIESEMVRGVFTDRSKAEGTLLGDLIDTFITDYAEKPENYRQRADKKEAWRFQLQHLKNALGQYSLSAIDQKLIKQYRADRKNTLWRGKPIQDSTIRKEIFMLSKLFQFAEQEENITLPRGNPVEKISKPGEGKSRDRRLSDEEWKKFEAECKKSRNVYLWPAVELAVETAMRQGEILALHWEYVSLETKTAFLKETKNDEPRSVPLSPRAREILEALRGRKKRGQVIPVERMTLYHAFAAAVQRAKIKDFTFHDLRHEAMSRFSERGDLSLLELAAISGHKTLQMLQRYTHLHAQKLANKLGA